MARAADKFDPLRNLQRQHVAIGDLAHREIVQIIDEWPPKGPEHMLTEIQKVQLRVRVGILVREAIACGRLAERQLADLAAGRPPSQQRPPTVLVHPKHVAQGITTFDDEVTVRVRRPWWLRLALRCKAVLGLYRL